MRALIVDDEKPARDEMRFLLSSEKDVEIVGEAAGGREAVELVKERHPDLVLLDIQMPEVDGFQVVRELLELGDPPLVVFATAYDRYAIKAFEVNALDYLLKPIDKARLSEALHRARKALPRRGEFARKLMALASNIRLGSSFLPRIVVIKGQEPMLVEIEKVAMLRREGSRVLAYTSDDTYPTNYAAIDDIEAQVDPAVFVRLGTDLLVNAGKIADVVPWSGGSFMMTLEDSKNTEVRLTRSQAKLLRSKALGGR